MLWYSTKLFHLKRSIKLSLLWHEKVWKHVACLHKIPRYWKSFKKWFFFQKINIIHIKHSNLISHLCRLQFQNLIYFLIIIKLVLEFKNLHNLIPIKSFCIFQLSTFCIFLPLVRHKSLHFFCNTTFHSRISTHLFCLHFPSFGYFMIR